MPTAEEAAIAAKLKSKGLPTEETQDEEVIEEVVEELEVEGGDETAEESQEGSEEVVEESEAEVSESELAAREAGWRPLTEWDGDEKDWVTADEFNRRGELLRKIHNQNRTIKQLDTVVANLAKQQKKIFDAGYDKARRELRVEHREAVREGNDAAADAIEAQMVALETQRQQDMEAVSVQVAPEQPAVAPEFVGWVQRNQWFIKNPALRSYAESIGTKHAADNPGKTNTQIYQYVTDEVKKRFPEEFGTVAQPKKKIGSPVAGSANLTSNNRASGSTVTRIALTAEEKAVGRMLVEKGEYKNLNEYAADLKKFGVKSS